MEPCSERLRGPRGCSVSNFAKASARSGAKEAGSSR